MSGTGRIITARLMIVWILFCASLASGQEKQKYTPEHRDVETVVERAVKHLHASPGKGIGEITLSALAIVEARKRYYQEIPLDDPVVKSAIAEILQALPADDVAPSADINLLRTNEVYIPCLALILLAEVDRVKYKEPIKRLIKSLQDRQMESGAFNYRTDVATIGDTSQTQYAALALYVAKHHGFAVNPQAGKGALDWLTQSQQPGGYFVYKLQGREGSSWIPIQGSTETRLSIHVGGLGTAYLLADLLQLTPRKKSLTQVISNQELVGLPKSVTVYVPPVDGDDSLVNQTGPLVNFDMGALHGTYQAGNRFFESNFDIVSEQWTFYYLYALERYAWFREQSEGDLGNGKIAQWYDIGVEYLKENQAKDGSFHIAAFQNETVSVCTSFAVLFLVRSSEVISNPRSEFEMAGGIGFPQNQIIKAEGAEIVGSEAEKNLADMIDLLHTDPTPEQLAALTKSLKDAVVEFKNKDDKSRSEIKSFLRTLISARDFYRRKIAVRFLAGEQDMDNVPALIYAVGDPDLRVCIEAHDGLRLISRKIDSLEVTDQTRRNSARDPGVLTVAEATAARLEFDSLKKQWTEWYLTIRPSAEMLD